MAQVDSPTPESGADFQYIKLPDGSYGKFAGSASDDVIRTAISRDFPDAFPRSVQSPIAPPNAAASSRANMLQRTGTMMDNDPDRDHPITPMDAVAGAVGPAARLTKTGYQAMAKGMTGGKLAPLGQPQPVNQTLSDAKSVAEGMALGVGEEGMPASSGAAAPTTGAASASAPRLVRSTSSAGAAASADAGGFSIKPILEMAQHVPGNIGVGARLLKKFGVGAEAEAAPAAAPLPHPLAGQGIHGTPVDWWGKTEAEVNPPAPAKAPVPRPAPAWQKLQKSQKAAAGAEADGQTLVERLYQRSMNMRDSTPGNVPEEMENAYTQQYLDAHRTGDAQQFAEHTRAYRELLQKTGESATASRTTPPPLRAGFRRRNDIQEDYDVRNKVSRTAASKLERKPR